ncbi:MAG: methyltransferase domain-containing protein [Vicinamibacterales bacterium]
MRADSVYESPRMAAGYAFSRPAVHPHIIRRVREALGPGAPVARALDLGCGAGLSTAALAPFARCVVGLEPAVAMLAHRHAVAPGASFVVARAEQLPFAAGAFDIVTAAGALNYVDLGTCLPDVARVLTGRGVMVVYDFSAGKRLRDDDRLDAWYTEFERRYPPEPGYEMDVRTLPHAEAGLRLASYAEFEVAVPMTRQAYVAYVMSETGVELAVARGVREADIERWCAASLAAILNDRPRDVLFDAYIACVRRRSPAASSSSSSPA